MNEVLITQILGTVEIIDGGKKITAKKGTKISLDAKMKTASNAKVEIEVNGQTYSIPNDRNISIKEIISMGDGNTGITEAGGVRG